MGVSYHIAPALRTGTAERSAEQQPPRTSPRAATRPKTEKLLKSLQSPNQARSAMNRKVRELEGLISLKKGNITSSPGN